jgi:uncharacterized protein (TIGR02996 family)
MSPPRPEVLAFLQDIKENPDDDTPRLIFADWLEEHGDPRGEFIRVQCELSRTAVDDPRRDELARRQRVLRDPNEKAWLHPIPDVLQIGRIFRRGLVQIHMRKRNAFPQEPEALAATEAWAWVEGISWDCWERLRRQGRGSRALPLLANLTSLRLSNVCLSGELGALFLNSPDRGLLAELDLLGTELRAAGASVLGTSPYLRRLASLTLVQTGLGPAGIAALAGGGRLERLTRLRVADDSLASEGVAVLAASPLLSRLSALDLEYNQIGPEGAQTLAASPAASALQYLRLANNLLGAAGTAFLGASPHFTALRSLDLTGNGLGDAGAVALANSPMLRQLRTLALGGNGITPAGGDALERSPYRHPALRLHLAGNPAVFEYVV